MNNSAAGPVRTTCPYCGVGCGVIATPRKNGDVAIAGDPDHPANYGRLCSKGAALGETLSLDGRLLHPVINGARGDWDTALDLVARRFSETVAQHGPDSVAFYVSGQILTEDYYVANKLMKGFIGSANIDTNSRLCMASSVAGHKRAFGADTVPGTYEDLEMADLVVLVGSNLAWCHPVLYQRLEAAREKRGTKVVVIDPRKTPTCDIADMHLAIAPGSDVALFNGLLGQLAGGNTIDTDFVVRHTTGAKQALAAALSMSVSDIARVTGVDKQTLLDFYDLFASTERVVTVYSQGVNQSSAGTDKVNAIINCHLATGRIGRPGMGPFSITGQPNAMGGREVGGLANMLACHMDIANPEHTRIVADFWRAPRIATTQGLKAVDMFRAVGDGRIKAIWIMATNPAVSMPQANAVRAALAACPFVVVSDIDRHTDTTPLAHVLLPSAGWGEKDGTVTNSDRRISRQRPFLAGPAGARPDWWQLAEVAKRMGFADAFSYDGPWQIFGEHAELSGLENDGLRDFDISRHKRIGRDDYNELASFRWPKPASPGSTTERFFADGNFYTPDGKARLLAISYRPLARVAIEGRTVVLNSGRIRDQWHTMTRTAKTARLMSHIAEPSIEVHPDDARSFGLRHAGLAVVGNGYGNAVLRVLITKRQLPGQVFAPMHWTGEFASSARINTMVADNTDPVSGQPELKGMPVSVRAFQAGWYGFAVAITPPVLSIETYWARAKAKAGWRIELAGAGSVDDWGQYARNLLEGNDEVEILAYHDTAAGQHRFAAFHDGRLHGLLFVAPHPVTVSRAWAAEQLGAAAEHATDRLHMLAGRAGTMGIDPGATVCACFNVGLNQIINAVATRNCTTVDAVGQDLRAGTNCGSCRPDIRRIVDDASLKKAG